MEKIRLKENVPEPDLDRIKIIEKARELGIPVFEEGGMDEILGEENPYLSHTVISGEGGVIKILESGRLASSRELGVGAMTYNSDRLMDMDKNVFLSLGKGYMKRNTYSLVFDLNKILQVPGISYVENDLMDITVNYIHEFLQDNLYEVLSLIEKNKEKLNEIFRKKVLHAFQGGGYGIYDAYFGDNPRDRVADFLEALKSKGFTGIREDGREENVINQFTILSDAILSEDILTAELIDKLKTRLKENVIVPNTITDPEEIKEKAHEAWESEGSNYRKFLPDDRFVPDKITEIRVLNGLALDLDEALLGIYVPK